MVTKTLDARTGTRTLKSHDGDMAILSIPLVDHGNGTDRAAYMDADKTEESLPTALFAGMAVGAVAAMAAMAMGLWALAKKVME